MASHAIRSLLFVLCVILEAFCSAVAQEPDQAHVSSASGSTREDSRGDRIYRHDPAPWNWNWRGRAVPGESAARLRFRAFQQKMAMRAARAAAIHPPASFSSHPPKQNLGGAPASSSTAWVPLGPAPLASDATGDGGQNYNWVSGRATSVLIDPADASGNTVAARGRVWRTLEVYERGKPESRSQSRSCFSCLGAFDRRSADAGGGRDCFAAGKQQYHFGWDRGN